MIISCIKRILFFSILGATALPAIAQSDLIGYWEPEIAFNYGVTDNYRHNFGLRQRSFIYTENQVELRLRQVDISHFSNWKLNGDEIIGGGILYRFRDRFEGSSNELRLTQQYNYTIRPAIVRYGHRARAEQRFTTRGVIYRFRYRFAVDLPLNGERTDVGEAYFSASTELLLSVSKIAFPEYDHRLTLQLGWLLSTKIRFQTGVEYRSEDFTNQNERIAFLLSSLIFSF